MSLAWCLIALCVEEIVVLALCLASCVEVVVLERGVVYSKFVFTKSSAEVPESTPRGGGE